MKNTNNMVRNRMQDLPIEVLEIIIKNTWPNPSSIVDFYVATLKICKGWKMLLTSPKIVNFVFKLWVQSTNPPSWAKIPENCDTFGELIELFKLDSNLKKFYSLDYPFPVLYSMKKELYYPKSDTEKNNAYKEYINQKKKTIPTYKYEPLPNEKFNDINRIYGENNLYSISTVGHAKKVGEENVLAIAYYIGNWLYPDVKIMVQIDFLTRVMINLPFSLPPTKYFISYFDRSFIYVYTYNSDPIKKINSPFIINPSNGSRSFINRDNEDISYENNFGVNKGSITTAIINEREVFCSSSSRLEQEKKNQSFSPHIYYANSYDAYIFCCFNEAPPLESQPIVKVSLYSILDNKLIGKQCLNNIKNTAETSLEWDFFQNRSAFIGDDIILFRGALFNQLLVFKYSRTSFTFINMINTEEYPMIQSEMDHFSTHIHFLSSQSSLHICPYGRPGYILKYNIKENKLKNCSIDYILVSSSQDSSKYKFCFYDNMILVPFNYLHDFLTTYEISFKGPEKYNMLLEKSLFSPSSGGPYLIMLDDGEEQQFFTSPYVTKAFANNYR